MSATPERVIDLKVNFAELALRPRRIIWRVTQLAAFAFAAIDRTTDEDFGELSLPESLVQMGPMHRPAPETRSAFRQWVIACALRDSVESMNLQLDDARRICALGKLTRQGAVPAEEWLADERVAESFHWLGLGTKLEALKKEYGFEPAPKETTDLLSINKARNCLVHRLGRVAEIDCNSPDGLTVTWTRLEVRTRGAAGERIVEAMPALLKKNEELVVTRAPGSKTFARGEQVDFTNREFSDIGFFLTDYAQSVAEVTEKVAALPPSAPSSTATPPATAN